MDIVKICLSANKLLKCNLKNFFKKIRIVYILYTFAIDNRCRSY